MNCSTTPLTWMVHLLLTSRVHTSNIFNQLQLTKIIVGKNPRTQGDSFIDGSLIQDGFDLILDCVGAPYLGRHLELLRAKGRLLLIGMMGGSNAEISLAPIIAKRVRIIDSLLRSRSVEERGVL